MSYCQENVVDVRITRSTEFGIFIANINIKSYREVKHETGQQKINGSRILCSLCSAGRMHRSEA